MPAATLVLALLIVVFGAELALSQSQSNETTPTPPPSSQMCFDNMLLASANQIVSLQRQELLCSLWKLNKRHVYGAQLSDDQLVITMLVTYPYSGSVHTTYLLEQYSVADGALQSSVELRQVLLPSVAQNDADGDDEAVSFCATATTVFSSWQGHLQLFDRTSGQLLTQPASAALSYGPYVQQSDRLWLSCSDSAAYMSVPAANAVWRLRGTDGLLEEVVARVQSPTALTVDASIIPNQLHVTSGRPAIMIQSYALSFGNGGSINVNSMPISTTPTAQLFRAVAAASSTPLIIVSLDDADGQQLALHTDPLSAAVMAARVPLVHSAQSLLASGSPMVVCNGMPVSLWTAQPTAPMASALLNGGNSDSLVYSALSNDASRQLITIDRMGALLMFTSPVNACPVQLEQVLPPLMAQNPQILYADHIDPSNPLLYTADGGYSLVWRPQLAQSEERYIVPTGPYCGGWPIEQAIVGPSPRQILCTLCQSVVECTSTNQVFQLPAHMQATPNWVRFAWPPQGPTGPAPASTALWVFFATTTHVELWSLIVDGQWADMGEWTPLWQMELSSGTGGHIVMDPTYYRVDLIYSTFYLIRLTATTAAMANLWNVSDTVASEVVPTAPLALLHFADASLLVGARLELVPNSLEAAPPSGTDMCFGYVVNTTKWPPPPPPSKLDRQQRAILSVATYIAVGVMLCGGAIVLTVPLLMAMRTARRRYKRMGAGFVCFWRSSARPQGAYGSLAEGGGEPGVCADLFCGTPAQICCFYLWQCFPPLAAYITELQERLVRPAHSYKARSGFEGHEEALYTGAAQPPSAGAGYIQPAGVAETSSLTDHDDYHHDEHVNPPQMVHVDLDNDGIAQSPADAARPADHMHPLDD